MGAADRSGPDGDRTAPDLVDGERFQRCARTDHVDDRVEGTDLVQLDVVRIDAVDRSLDLGEAGEHRASPSSDALGEVGIVEQAEHVAGRSVCSVITGRSLGLRVFVDDDVRPRGPDSAALDPLEQQGVAVDAEPADRLRDHVGIGARVDERGHRHVAGHAGLAVEPRHPNAGAVVRHRVGHVRIRATAAAAPKPLSMPTTVTPLAHEACMASRAVTPSRPEP